MKSLSLCVFLSARLSSTCSLSRSLLCAALFSLFFSLTLASTTQAQTQPSQSAPTSDKVKVEKDRVKVEKKEPLWNWSDALLLSSFAADEISTSFSLSRCSSCREAGVLKSHAARITAKAGAFTLIKLIEWKAGGKDRKTARWIKTGLALFFTGVAIHNFRQR